MQSNASKPAPRRPAKPLQRPRSGGTRQATPSIPPNDLPPGMGGGESGSGTQAYHAQASDPAQHANTAYQQGSYHTNHYGSQPPAQSSMNTKAIGGIGIGVLLIVVGIGATMYSYGNAGPGQSYTVWWGPVVFGVVTLIGGVGALFKK